VLKAEGPNDNTWSTYFNGPENTMASDPDLASLNNTNNLKVHDYVYLQFDFIPNATSMQFKYAFASEEYPQYVNTEYNDIFGFFVTDVTANIKHGNIAVLPDGASKTNGNYVGINTINNGNWNDLFFSTHSNAGYSTNSINTNWFIPYKATMNYSTPVYSPITQYNGSTKEMTASIKNLIPCHTYRLKLAVANVFNENFGSAVFLKAGSFVLEDHAEVHLVSNNAETSDIFKGCDNTVMRFTRPDSESTIEQTYNLSYTGTADYDTDYTESDGSKLPATITFPAGQKSVDMSIKATDVAVAGSQFAVSIYYTSPDCTSTEASSVLTVTINDRTADAGPDITQANPIFTMAASPATGTWSVVSPADGVTIANTSSYDTAVTLDISKTKTATLRWTVNSSSSCPDDDDVILTYKKDKVYLRVNPNEIR
jgi:hypothetical protein